VSAIRTLSRALGRGTLAALALAVTAGALHAQDEIEYNDRGKPIRRPGSYTPTPSTNPTTGPFAGRYEYCFAGVGPQCAGAPGAPVRLRSTGTYAMMVSVGSILHDNCCLRNPAGKWCGGTGVDGVNKAEEGNHNGQCVKEWDKAWWNTIDRRQWEVAVNTTVPGNLTPAPGRLASRKDGTMETIEEVVQSRLYSAPAGTSLDRGDEAFCASGRASAPQQFGASIWIVCQ
jgi:hypothetical protein